MLRNTALSFAETQRVSNRAFQAGTAFVAENRSNFQRLSRADADELFICYRYPAAHFPCRSHSIR